MTHQIEHFVLAFTFGCAGAIIQEIAHWWELRFTLHHKKYDTLIRSRVYWVVVVLFALSGGLFTVGWFYDGVTDPKTFMLTGAAFPLILKQGAASAVNAKRLTLGQPKGPERSPMLEYFRARRDSDA